MLKSFYYVTVSILFAIGQLSDSEIVQFDGKYELKPFHTKTSKFMFNKIL